MNPFIRVKMKADSSKMDLNANHILGFAPVNSTTDGGTEIRLSDGSSYTVVESAQAVRGAIRRAFNPKDAATDESASG